MGSHLPTWMKRHEAKEANDLHESAERPLYDTSLRQILNLPPPPPEEPTWLWMQRQDRERAKCDREWDEAQRLIREKCFASRKEIAAHFGKRVEWAYTMVKLMVEQNEFTTEELKALVPGRPKKD